MNEHDYRPGGILRWLMIGVVILVLAWVAVSIVTTVTHPMGMYPYQFYHPFFFPFGIFFGGLVYYYLVKWYRMKRGIDLSLVYKQIPPE